jgi:hypothetical protein
MRGLLDISFLGTVLELTWLMDGRTYGMGKPISEVECLQRVYAIRAYIKFNKVFNDRQQILLSRRLQDPILAVFRPILHKVVVTLYKYKLRNPNELGCHWAALRKNLLVHVKRFRPELMGDIERDMAISAVNLHCCQTFEWQGPDFQIRHRAKCDWPMTGMSCVF